MFDLKNKSTKKSSNSEFKSFILKNVCPILCLSLIAGGVGYVSSTGSAPSEHSSKSTVSTYRYMEQDKKISATATSFSNDNIVKAYGVYLDDTFVGVVSTVADFNSAEKAVISDFEKEYRSKKIKILPTLKCKTGYYSEQDIITIDELVTAIKNAKNCTVQATINEVRQTELPYSTKIIEDDTQYEDYTETVKDGQAGVAEETYDIKYINGQKAEENKISSTITQKTVNKVVKVGTKKHGGVASGSFIWPCPYTTNITSEFGPRWGTNHQGIDISAGGIYGQDVVASDGGVVTKTSYSDYGYGFHIEIDHGNGMQTRYAHLSDIYVSVGDNVAQGDVIGAVGTTGDSTGPHLHFEIMEDWTQYDPLSYLN